jgi:serine/threonine protein kinase
VKPSNILVSPDGQVKLSDFGIARAEADASLTQTGLVTGSPAYLSPEVATGRSATDASDVWSIGATLYHALAGHPPYEVGDNVLGALYRIVHEDPPRLVGAGWLTPLLGVTMAREPADRWSMDRVRDFLMAGPQATVPAPARTSVPPPAPPVAPAEAPTHVLPLPGPPMAPQATSSPVAPANDRRRGSLPAVLAAALAVVAIAVVGWVAFRTGTGDDDQPATGSAPHSGDPGTSPSSSSSGAPAARAATADGMRAFVEDYLATVTTDPAAAWQRLTPGFQAESGNFGQYQHFWNGIRSAEVVNAHADPSSRQVSYTVDYVHRDGTRTSDDVTLVLEGTDGDYRISGES